MAKSRVLVIDDSLEMAKAIVEYLTRNGLDAEGVDTGTAGIERFRLAPADVVLTDLRMQGLDGMDVLQAIHRIDAEVPVIIMTAFGAVETAVESIQRGAFHYVTKPFKLDVVRVLLDRAIAERSMRAENAALRRTVRENLGAGLLIGRSAAIKTALALVHRVAEVTVPVLVLGETGSGKELVARAVHAEGPRKENPFIAVNCAAVPEALLESELFGHLRGAFTGATQTRRGLFVEADGGTLLLDEIGEMALPLQAKLLRVLETGEVRAVGSDASRTTNVRILASTHRDLPGLVRDGRFRQDLFFRLNVVPIHIAPLRERREDIPLLIEHFLRRSSDRFPRATAREFSPESTKMLIEYPWPGNVRELENLIDRLVITGERTEIRPADVRSALGDAGEDPLQVARRGLLPLAEVEQQYINWVIERVAGNKTRAAEILQIDPSTLYRRGKQQGKT